VKGGPTRRRLAIDRHQVLILAIGAVMAGSFVMFVLWPRQRELSALGSAVERERDLVEQKVIESRTGELMTVRMPEIRRDRDLLERRLPPEPRLPDFLHAVAACVASEPLVTQEVKRDEVSPGGAAPACPPESEETARAVPIHLRLVGPFAAVLRCVAAIEGLERLCRFRDTHLVRTGDGQVAAEAEILVYYLPLSDAAVRRAADTTEMPSVERPAG
jgi:Tfp pilus assembly protein PilO